MNLLNFIQVPIMVAAGLQHSNPVSFSWYVLQPAFVLHCALPHDFMTYNQCCDELESYDRIAEARKYVKVVRNRSITWKPSTEEFWE